jgi:hypothetical protein
VSVCCCVLRFFAARALVDDVSGEQSHKKSKIKVNDCH